MKLATQLQTEEEPKTRRQTCTDHCAGCNAHFHGLTAFDAHRQSGECVLPSSAVASKGKNAGQPLLQAWTEDGYCTLQSGCKHDGKVIKTMYPVVIWQRVGSGYGVREDQPELALA